MNAEITRNLHYTNQFLESLLLVHGEGVAAQGEGGAAQGEAWQSETLVCELAEDILYRVSMLFKVKIFCTE